MFHGTSSEDTFPMKTYDASNMLSSEIKFAIKYLDFLLSISSEYRFGGMTRPRLMSSPKCRSVEVINNPARPGSNHREVNCINYRQQ